MSRTEGSDGRHVGNVDKEGNVVVEEGADDLQVPKRHRLMPGLPRTTIQKLPLPLCYGFLRKL